MGAFPTTAETRLDGVDTRTLLTHYSHLWQVIIAAFNMGIREKSSNFE
jgi:hypothetical protein